ncbi:conserved hypothetical protein [Rippkaea orientalis PCC 8801]|uniref:DUF2252 domain-containing protein n=1 Tax=Rippkaea orientalis (strain PCC 8801 / RF-1) TaxID=41431 RepID=B7K1K6_RIPO1|nr:DUF2252 family protein [Rippkaea orientalis]ACK67548.1 conserved hypothetical protein [Rippkaea orientalis PCC 8801]
MNKLIKIFPKLFLVFIIIGLLNIWGIGSKTLAEPINNNQRTEQIVKSIESDTAKLLEGMPQQEQDCLKAQKYCKMGEAIFPFYRATNHLFWSDFAQDSRLNQFGNPKTKTWLSGDLHIDNFGSYANDKGEVIFDLNDFDESMVADYQYDLWRLATSIILASNQGNLLSPSEQEQVIEELSESYLNTLASYQGNDDETKIYFTQKNTSNPVKKLLEKAQKQTQEELLNEWTTVENNQRKFDLSNSKLGSPCDLQDTIKAQINAYSQPIIQTLNYDKTFFTIKDIARRLNAGLGSLGTPRYYVLIEGKTSNLDDDLLLDIKRQYKPIPYQFLGLQDQQNYDQNFDNDAQRHAVAYRALIKKANDYLGWIQIVDDNVTNGDLSGYYSVQEISAKEKSLKTEKLTSKDDWITMAKLWGQILATDHARADQDFSEKYVPYSLEKQVTQLTDGKHKQFLELVKTIAFDYAAQVQVDYDSFVKELKPQNCSSSDCSQGC